MDDGNRSEDNLAHLASDHNCVSRGVEGLCLEPTATFQAQRTESDKRSRMAL